jgi:hypothetical protein
MVCSARRREVSRLNMGHAGSTASARPGRRRQQRHQRRGSAKPRCCCCSRGMGVAPVLMRTWVRTAVRREARTAVVGRAAEMVTATILAGDLCNAGSAAGGDEVGELARWCGKLMNVYRPAGTRQPLKFCERSLPAFPPGSIPLGVGALPIPAPPGSPRARGTNLGFLTRSLCAPKAPGCHPSPCRCCASLRGYRRPRDGTYAAASKGCIFAPSGGEAVLGGPLRRQSCRRECESEGRGGRHVAAAVPHRVRAASAGVRRRQHCVCWPMPLPLPACTSHNPPAPPPLQVRGW